MSQHNEEFQKKNKESNHKTATSESDQIVTKKKNQINRYDKNSSTMFRPVTLAENKASNANSQAMPDEDYLSIRMIK